MPLKRHMPDVQFSGNKLTPDEFDQDQQYVITKPTASTGWFGTAETASDGTVVAVNTYADYPRNVRVAITGVSGGMGGTVTVTGKDQFGVQHTEAIGFASADGGGTANGTTIFGEVSQMAHELDGLGGTAVGTIAVGVQSGTSATGPIFGLPAKLGGTADLKFGTWIDDGTAKQLIPGTDLVADTNNHAVRVHVTGGAVAADDFVVTFRSSYDATDDGTIAKT